MRAEYKIEILPAAWHDLERIADTYLALVGADAAERITDRILDTIDGLAVFPYMGALHPDPVLAQQEYRKIICGDYIAVYRVIDKTVAVYRIVNGKTDYPRLLK